MTKIKLIANWRSFWRFWSIQLGVIGSAVTGILVAFPDLALETWQTLPEELKQTIPEHYTPLIGVVVFVLSLIARMLKQAKLETKGNENE